MERIKEIAEKLVDGFYYTSGGIAALYMWGVV